MTRSAIRAYRAISGTPPARLAPGLAAAKPASAQVSPAEGTITGLRERNRVDNRAATVDAAFVLFAERGYCHVTVADICEAAGIGRRTFFRYFAIKDDVLTEPAREMTVRGNYGDRVDRNSTACGTGIARCR
jgi:hypothetical protein